MRVPSIAASLLLLAAACSAERHTDLGALDGGVDDRDPADATPDPTPDPTPADAGPQQPQRGAAVPWDE